MIGHSKIINKYFKISVYIILNSKQYTIETVIDDDDTIFAIAHMKIKVMKQKASQIDHLMVRVL